MKKTFGFSVHDIVEIAMLCSLSIILDQFLKIRIGATGGSINLSMLPLLIISLRHGPFKGFIGGGIVFGFITCLIDGYGLVTYPLEYFIAFGVVGILGFFSHFIHKSIEENNKKNIILSYIVILVSMIIMLVVRVLCGTIDTLIIFSEYGYTFWAAVLYHLSYAGPSSGVVFIVLSLLLPAIVKINRLIKSPYLKD